MWTPLDTVFLGRLGPSLEPIILQRLEGKAWRKGYVREVPSILGRLSNFLKTIDFEVFDRHKLENHCFEKQAPGSIPPGSPFMACLDVFGPILFVRVFLHDRFPLSLNGAASNEAMEPSREGFFARNRSHNRFSRPLFSCSLLQTSTGWWFGTFFLFPYIGNNHPN